MNTTNRFQRLRHSSPEQDSNTLPVAANNLPPQSSAARLITSGADGADTHAAAVPETTVSNTPASDAAMSASADASANKLANESADKSADGVSAAGKKPFWKNAKIMVALWIVMLGIIPLGLLLQVDKS
ncbi:MAG: hypothetical protein IAF08_04410, partial [Rhizobacter sp.]|nr:hypothetical protein [Chlorobiales bacterium]